MCTPDYKAVILGYVNKVDYNLHKCQFLFENDFPLDWIQSHASLFFFVLFFFSISIAHRITIRQVRVILTQPVT